MKKSEGRTIPNVPMVIEPGTILFCLGQMVEDLKILARMLNESNKLQEAQAIQALLVNTAGVMQGLGQLGINYAMPGGTDGQHS